MKKLIKSKLFIQVIVASMVATLATAGIVAATTSTIGANITTTGNLTVDTQTLYVSSTANRVGIGTTTPFASLSINNEAAENAFVIGSSTATWLKVDSSGLLTVAKGATFSDTLAITGNLTVDTQTLFVGATNNRVGVGTTTPFASLSINNEAGENAFVIGSSTATWLKVDSSGLLTVAKGATFSSTLGVTGATSLGTLAAGNTAITGTLTASTGLGAASTTPMAQLSIGAGTAATSTISTGKFCMYAGTINGTMVYITLGDNQPANQPFATSTISCF